MALPIEQRDIAIDLNQPAPRAIINLLNLTHATKICRSLSGDPELVEVALHQQASGYGSGHRSVWDCAHRELSEAAARRRGEVWWLCCGERPGRSPPGDRWRAVRVLRSKCPVASL